MTHAPAQIADDLIALDLPSPERAQSVAQYVRTHGGWAECVAGLGSVTVQFDPLRHDAAEVIQALARLAAEAPDMAAGDQETVTLNISYGGTSGPDLETTCARLGLSAAEFIARHCAATYRVEMIGFTPGFAYIGGLAPSLSVPRLSDPRAHVPAGSVGISGAYTGIYALDGPGGWPIVGAVQTPLFDPDLAEPFRLRPGQNVRFRAGAGI